MTTNNKLTWTHFPRAAWKQRYPDAGMDVALNIGAKAALGEMKWG